MKRLRGSLLLVALAVAGGVVGDEVRFLIPFYRTPIAGAYGSRWVAETNVFNGGEQHVFVDPRPWEGCPDTCPSGGAILSYSAPTPFEYISYLTAGEAIFVSVQPSAANVRFASRIRDTSRDADSAGTEIPIVREEQFSATPLQLINVPRKARFRHTLRIYALPEIAEPEVEIRYYAFPLDPHDGVDRQIPVYVERRPLDRGALARIPSTLIISSIEQLPQLSGVTNFWIEVVPITPELRIWTFLSITNDDTQQVTLVSPNTHTY